MFNEIEKLNIINVELFKYVSSSQLDPLFLLPDMQNKKIQPHFNYLKEAIYKIPLYLIDSTLNDPNVNFYLNLNNPLGKDFEAGLSILTRYFQKKIPIEKYNILKHQDEIERPDPYNHDTLIDIPLDEFYLVELRYFKPVTGGFERNGYIFTIIPPVPATNACYWLHNFLKYNELYKKIKVRLDPFNFAKATEFMPIEERMRVWGRSLDWNRIIGLKEAEHGQWRPDSLSRNDIYQTDYIWYPHNDEVTFTCEEIPNLENNACRGSRYFHGIYSKKDNEIIHCDGAIRFTSEEELINRMKGHVKDANVKKIGKRIKTFMNTEKINFFEFCNLASTFFVWNNDVIRYFQ